MLETTILLLAAAFAAGAQDNTLTAQEKKQGWVLLFDGKSLDRWVDPRHKNPPGDAWTIDAGAIKTLRRPRLTEDLFSKETYRDFELVFDWRISEGGNSGVKYRIQDHFWLAPEIKGQRFEMQVNRSVEAPITVRPAAGQDYVVGFEYQMTDDRKNLDSLSNPKHTAGALYDMAAPSAHPLKPAGEFNHSRIVVKGNHAEHWLNGEKVVDTALDSAGAMEGINKRWSVAPKVLEMLARQPRKDCPISLQNHGDDAWFKNIKIRRL